MLDMEKSAGTVNAKDFAGGSDILNDIESAK